jgi:hypothetical protein
MTYFRRLVEIFRKILILFIVKPRYSEWKLVSPAIHYIEVLLYKKKYYESEIGIELLKIIRTKLISTIINNSY